MSSTTVQSSSSKSPHGASHRNKLLLLLAAAAATPIIFMYEPTSWFPTYHPTSSADDEQMEKGLLTRFLPRSQLLGRLGRIQSNRESLVTYAPTTNKPIPWSTHEPTVWSDDGYASQATDKEAEEAEDNSIPSPTTLPSSVPTLNKNSSFTPTPSSTTKEKEDYASASHAIISLVPSQAPSEGITPTPWTAADGEFAKIFTSVPSSLEVIDDQEQECPEYFDESAFYVKDDVI